MNIHKFSKNSVKRFLAISTIIFVSAVSSALAADNNQKSSIKSGDRIVILGDSITFFGSHSPTGFVNLIKSALQANHPGCPVQFINAGACFANVDPPYTGKAQPSSAITLIAQGVCANNSVEATSQLDKVFAFKPNLVIVEIAVNDCWHYRPRKNKGGVSLEDFKVVYPKLVNDLKQRAGSVVICTPTVIYEKKSNTNNWDAMLDQYAQAVRDAGKSCHAKVCDLHTAFKEYIEAHNTQDAPVGVLTRDGVHMNEQGDLLMAKKILEAIGEKSALRI